MSVIQKLIDAQDNQDLKAYNEVLSEDYYWLRHSTGEKVPRDELSKWLISPDAPKSENARIIYENDEIGVAHYFVSFKDGSNPVSKPIWDEVMDSYEIYELNKV